MIVDPKFDAYLILRCRCCSHDDIFLVSLAEARLMEAAFVDRFEVLSFQCLDGDGIVRTMNLERADYKSANVTALTENEKLEVRRLGQKPLPLPDIRKMLNGTMTGIAISGGKGGKP